jgi:hypothetical protein
MATRIDKKVSQNLDIANNYTALRSYLLRRAGRKLNDINYTGLIRDNALNDLDDPGEALTNVLEYITRIDDANEISLYGTYKPEDFEITREFVENEITKEFLQPLEGLSIAGGLAGATVSVNPRLRIEDRIDQIDALFGRGTLDNLHSGPTSFFYRVKSGVYNSMGFLEFDFDSNTGSVTTSVILGTDGITTITEDDILDGKSKVVISIESYVNPSTDEEIKLAGSGLDILVDATSLPVTWTILNNNAKAGFVNLKSLLGVANFPTTKFKIYKEFSYKEIPSWYTESPNNSEQNVAGSPDDIDPQTSFGVLNFFNGKFSLYKEDEYFYSRYYVETRWTQTERDLLGSNPLAKDSNLRYQEPPRVLSDYNDNWGVRWDGYLRLSDNGSVGKYIFSVQTNTAIKIDIANKTGLGPWTTVFDSVDATKSAQVGTSDRYVSKVSFDLSETQEIFKYYRDSALNSSFIYLPISIRMWNGQADKSEPDFEIPTDPNLFIKLGSTTSGVGTQDLFESGRVEAIITDTGTDIVISPSSGQNLNLLSIVTNANNKVSYRLVAKEETVTLIEEDDEGNITETVDSIITEYSTYRSISITESGGVLYGNALADGTGKYIIEILPDTSSYDLNALWSGRIITPPPSYSKYNNFIDGSFEPSIYKYAFDERPQWWKVSDGNRYLYGDDVTRENTPLDGFISNSFRTTLRSIADGEGLYGNGSGTYTTRKNIILGEAAYQNDEVESGNYLGMRFIPNLLGEGGKIKFTGLPVNNALFSDSRALGANDLGGDPNHLTEAANNIAEKKLKIYWDSTGSNKFYLHPDYTQVTTSDAPEDIGLSPFSSTSIWNSPITVNGVAGCSVILDTEGANPATYTIASGSPLITISTSTAHGLSDGEFYGFIFDPSSGGGTYDGEYEISVVNATSFTISVTPTPTANSTGNVDVLELKAPFTSPLTLSVEKAEFTNDVGGTIYTGDLLAFTTTFAPAETELNGAYLFFYLERDIAFQYANIDTGESVSFSDTLKLTYNLYVFNGGIGYEDGLYEDIELQAIAGTYSVSPTANPIVDITVSEGKVTVVTITNSPIIELNTQFELVDADAIGALGSGLVVSYQFLSSLSEVPKVPSERVTPFGFDEPDYSPSGVCYPPYTISDVLLSAIAKSDAQLYAANEGNYDVFWGDHTKQNLGGNSLNITEKLEFSYPISEDVSNIIKVSTKTLAASDYTHRLKVELPLPSTGYDEDMLEHIGNQEKVKDIYYLFVNGKANPTSLTNTTLLSGLG